MFGRQFPGRYPHRYLRQLCLSMPNDKVNKRCITTRRRNRVIHYLLNEEEKRLLKHRRLVPMQWGCWNIGVWCQYNDQGPTGRARGLLNCFLGAGHFSLLASSDISKGWRIIADERVVSWWSISDRLSASADCGRWSTVNLIRRFVRMQKSSITWECNKKFLYLPHHQNPGNFHPRQCSRPWVIRKKGALAILTTIVWKEWW